MLPEELARMNVIGESPELIGAFTLLRRFAGGDAAVLIQGETGTGKELAVRAVHYLSGRRSGPFVPVNCGGIAETLVESELFGHVRGAFTDAREGHRGLVHEAEGGTLFLDEVEALPLRAQAAVLRFLQDGTYRPVGSQRSVQSNVRIVAASNADLDALASERSFRADLVFRLRVLHVTLPPLRDRGDDAVLIASALLRRLSRQYERPEVRLHPGAADWIRQQPWLGNVRELENLIHREFVLCEGSELRLGGVATTGASASSTPVSDIAGSPSTPPTFRVAKARAVAAFERSYVADLLALTGGNVSEAARLAGKERSRFGRLVKKHGLERSSFARRVPAGA